MRIIHRDIVGIFIFSADQQLLMGKGGVYGDAWLIPGGGIEAGETKLEAAHREILEEVGIDLAQFVVEPIDIALTGESEKTLRDTGERVLVKMTFFNFRATSTKPAKDVPVISDDDFSDAQWHPIQTLKDLKLSPPTIATLKQLGYLS